MVLHGLPDSRFVAFVPALAPTSPSRLRGRLDRSLRCNPLASCLNRHLPEDRRLVVLKQSLLGCALFYPQGVRHESQGCLFTEFNHILPMVITRASTFGVIAGGSKNQALYIKRDRRAAVAVAVVTTFL